ncbi:glycosyltransferase family 2 protein [Herbaspirillum sp. LeCh32-8]|uniref:glycosyltransferase family 2 protein n=1 Tax=Herbaspirillum sp. LeCh32-8 TaxID=2821356 RepID=UPI001AE80099|nr:glycosyltransferase family 2 protein [Herbaspirillum sp. LeCh32-8]MBP0598389.1 glycosyltransferase family 2 protein [Herbaspirillum sp. LeCh32-8]
MAEQPLVTIGLPIYNAQSTLADAIESILQQSWENWELLLLDDGSTDGSAQVAARFRDARIQWISDGANRGISSRLNQALDMARGEYFCRMDADDMSFPQRLQRQIDVLNARPGVDLVASSVLTFTSDGQAGGIVRVAAAHAQICARPWNGFHFPHPAWMGRTAWFRRHRYISTADGAEDQHLLYRSFGVSEFAGMEEVLLAYRDDRTSFRKLLGRRLRFWKVIAGAAFSGGRRRDGILVCLRQPAKILSDFLFICCGFSAARNRLAPASETQLHAWDALKRSLRERSCTGA